MALTRMRILSNGNSIAFVSLFFFLPAGGLGDVAHGEELRISSATAYIDPDPSGARVSAEKGITRWTDPELSVKWYGELKQTGEARAKVELLQDEGKKARFKMSVAGRSREVSVDGNGGRS
jgi:hypothetical protein